MHYLGSLFHNHGFTQLVDCFFGCYYTLPFVPIAIRIYGKNGPYF